MVRISSTKGFMRLVAWHRCRTGPPRLSPHACADARPPRAAADRAGALVYGAAGGAHAAVADRAAGAPAACGPPQGRRRRRAQLWLRTPGALPAACVAAGGTACSDDAPAGSAGRRPGCAGLPAVWPARGGQERAALEGRWEAAWTTVCMPSVGQLGTRGGFWCSPCCRWYVVVLAEVGVAAAAGASTAAAAAAAAVVPSGVVRDWGGQKQLHHPPLHCCACPLPPART